MKISKQEVLTFLRTQEGCVISTLSPQQEIESSFVYFASNEDLNVYFITGRHTGKYKNILANKKISFVVADAENSITVQGRGEALEIENEDEGKRVYDLLLQIYHEKIQNWPPPFEKMKEAKLAILKINFSWLRYANFKDLKEGSFDDFYSQILP